MTGDAGSFEQNDVPLLKRDSLSSVTEHSLSETLSWPGPAAHVAFGTYVRTLRARPLGPIVFSFSAWNERMIFVSISFSKDHVVGKVKTKLVLLTLLGCADSI